MQGRSRGSATLPHHALGHLNALKRDPTTREPFRNLPNKLGDFPNLGISERTQLKRGNVLFHLFHGSESGDRNTFDRLTKNSFAMPTAVDICRIEESDA